MSPEVSSREYIVKHEDGTEIDWLADKQAALTLAASEMEPCYVEEHVHFYPVKTLIWASHHSMLEDSE